MANSLPWSVKGVDPRTRDAAKAAARRAGMTLGEWLDHKIRDEAAEAAPSGVAQPEQLDIAALSERLARLSQIQTETAPRKVSPPPPAPDRREVEVLVRQAETMEKLTRESSQRTAGALDSITRWIEKTEDRLSAGERSAAERQERATNVIAEAIKTMGERIADIERRSHEAQPSPRSSQAAPRLAFSRDGLAAAVTDIRSRQRLLDHEQEPVTANTAAAQDRIAALREDLRALGSRIGQEPGRRPAAAPAAPPSAARDELIVQAIEAKITALGERLERLDRRDQFEPVLKPLARIEAEVSRLSQDRSGEAYQRFELEIAHLAAKIDALATRGGEPANLTPLLRDMAELRTVISSNSQDERLEELSHQIASLSFEVGRLREMQPDLREMRSLSAAIEDVRGAVLTSQSRDLYSAPLADLGQQIDGLTHKLDAIARHRPGDQIDGRIDALQARLERLAEEGPAGVTRQLDSLAARIDGLAASNQLTRMVGEDGASVDFSPIEAMLQRLADKIDEAGAPGANTESFEALEQQISGLAARLDEAAATRNAESSIERTLQDLVVHLRSAREETAAERAALAQATGAAPGKGIAELSTLVSGLRDTQVSSERQTQDTLGAVHHTLEAIMGRLASLEGELLSDRKPARPAAPRSVEPQNKRAPVAETREPVALVATAEDRGPIAVPASVRAEPTLDIAPSAFDLPLEPGSGRPRPEPTPAAGNDAQSIRQSLIAAARRSAKAATEAAAAPSAAATEPAAKSPSRLREIMTKRKRPLLLALAAVVLAMGTAHVVTGALNGNGIDTARNTTPAAPAASQPEAAPVPPQADPAPAQDKSSALPMDATAARTAEAEPASRTASLAMAPGDIQQPTASQQPGQDSLQPVTGLGDLPAGLGGAGVRKAALDGDARAVYELASRAADGPAGTRDPKVALRLFERAAVAGLAPAQFRLGNMFEKGIGTQRDLGLARTWYERAAERGNAKAMHNLAVLYAEGAAGKPDYATATQWFAKAAELGVRDSQYNLAVLLGRGLGAPMDLGQSYLWFSVAAAQGDEDAGKKRDEVAQRLKPEDLAAAKARAAGWKPKALDAAANEVAAPAKGWDAAPTAAADKPAKPGRPARS